MLLRSGSFAVLRGGQRAFASSADATIARTNQLFIDNVYVPAEGGATLDVLSPADGAPLTTIAHASAADVDRAVRSARACFDESGWPSTPVEERVGVLKRVAAALRERQGELAEIETRDCGKPLGESDADIGFCADMFDYYAETAAASLAPTKLSIPGGADAADDFAAHVRHEALGVVGCITPWNFPLMQSVVKVAPALAAGCATVLKPSPLASLTSLALGEIVAQAGAPAGALNVVTGGPPELVAGGGSTGQSLIDHPLLDKISFTGSGTAGQLMLASSSPHLRPTSLELGGKSAVLVFPDAAEHIDALVDWVMVGIFVCTGQVCSATSRLIVHKDIEPLLTERLLAAAAKLKVGDPLAEGTQMGPAISRAQLDKIEAAVARAEAEGATVHRAALDLPAELQSGYFTPPTVLTGVGERSSAWTDEIFGPVLSVRTFETEEEAVAAANDTPYGLANAVFSADAARCSRVSAALHSGVVWENCSQVLFPSTPFGGRAGKKSGFTAEYGYPGLEEYLSHKTIVSATTPGYGWGWYGGSSA